MSVITKWKVIELAESIDIPVEVITYFKRFLYDKDSCAYNLLHEFGHWAVYPSWYTKEIVLKGKINDAENLGLYSRYSNQRKLDMPCTPVSLEIYPFDTNTKIKEKRLEWETGRSLQMPDEWAVRAWVYTVLLKMGWKAPNQFMEGRDTKKWCFTSDGIGDGLEQLKYLGIDMDNLRPTEWYIYPFCLMNSAIDGTSLVSIER